MIKTFLKPAALVAASFLFIINTGAQTLDKIAAVVNDDIILMSAVNQKTETFMRQIQPQIDAGATPPPVEMIQKNILDQLITESIQIQLAEKNNIIVDSDNINAAINSLAQQNNVSFNEFILSLREQGISYGQFREDIRKEIMVQRIQQQMVSRRISMTPVEVERYQAMLAKQSGAPLSTESQVIEMPEYNVQHILLKVEDESQAAALKAELEAIRKQINAGEDFSVMAKKFSQDPGSAIKGGDLGWVIQGIMVANFEQQMMTATVGEISPVFRTQFGWHILRVNDTRMKTREENAQFQQAQQMLYQQRFQESLQSWLKEIRDSSSVDIKI